MRNKILQLSILFIGVVFSGFAQMSIGDTQEGIMSYYNDNLHGNKTANGEVYDKTKISGAHKTLPFHTIIEVVNVENKKSVFVEINDRLPKDAKEFLRVSRATAESLSFIERGKVKGRLKIIQYKNNSHLVRRMAPRTTDKSFSQVKKEAVKIADAPKTNFPTIVGRSAKPSVYGIQLAAFSSLEAIKQIKEKAKKMGFSENEDLFIFKEQVNGKTIYKLVGGLYSREKAKAKAVQIANSFPDVFLVKIKLNL